MPKFTRKTAQQRDSVLNPFAAGGITDIRDMAALAREAQASPENKDRVLLFDSHGRVVWRSNPPNPETGKPNPQTLFLWNTCLEILFGGQRGGGKSDALVIKPVLGNWRLSPTNPLFASYTLHPNYRAIIYRETADDLKEFVSRCEEIYCGYFGAVKRDDPPYFQFQSGARIYTSHLNSISAAINKSKGPSYHFVGVEELTQIPMESTYLAIFGSCRSTIPEIPQQICSTTNPDGPGADWVERRFVSVPDQNGNIIPWGNVIVDPILNTTRIFIPSSLNDNPYLRDNVMYKAQLEMQPEHRRQAWRHGVWGAREGTYYPEFRPVRRDSEPEHAFHVVPAGSVLLQPWWYRWASGDWGFRHNSAFYKFCYNPDDKRIYTYGELVVAGLGPFELGVRVGYWLAPELEGLMDTGITLYFSHDAFNRTDERRSRAEQLQDGINSVLGPDSAFVYSRDESEVGMGWTDSRTSIERRYTRWAGSGGITIVPATRDRIGSSMYIHDLLRWRPVLTPVEVNPQYAQELMRTRGMDAYTQYIRAVEASKVPEVLPRVRLFDDCPQLIKFIPKIVHPPETMAGKNKEEPLKVTGDDTFDGWRLGCYAFQAIQNEPPRDYAVAMAVHKYSKGVTDPVTRNQIAAFQAQKYDAQHSGRGAGVTFNRMPWRH